ncbi:MAG: LCP family protein [Oscillospiraceae bacterium]|nr:LCP family protein [Oscillospiraceae bacterium]
MSQQNRKNRKTRFFALAFALSFFTLAMMGLIVVFVFNPLPENPVSSQISADTFYLPQKEDNLTVLLVGRGARKEDLPLFALVRLDMLGGRIPVVLFPAQTILHGETGFSTLEDAYEKEGARAVAKALSDSFSVPVDRYADMDSQAIIDGVNRIGVAEYELAESLSYNENGIFISLSAGRQLIDGQKFLDILRYPAYGGGALQQCEEGAKLIASYLNSRLDTFLGRNAEALVGGLLDLADTDISYLDFQSRLPALTFLSKLSGDPSVPHALTGGWNKAGEFVPDAAARRRLVQAFA